GMLRSGWFLGEPEAIHNFVGDAGATFSALLCQGECGDEEDAERDGMGQFIPAEFAYRQGRWALDEVIPSAEQEWGEGDGSNRGNKSGETCDGEQRGHCHLSGGECPAAFELSAKAFDAGSVDSELYVVDLVSGKDQVR